jgi:hypothetical protein
VNTTGLGVQVVGPLSGQLDPDVMSAPVFPVIEILPGVGGDGFVYLAGSEPLKLQTTPVDLQLMLKLPVGGG